ncbi:hypothetical protein CYMTET_51742, partial [Cymbomonas tetramitiformis]
RVEEEMRRQLERAQAALEELLAEEAKPKTSEGGKKAKQRKRLAAASERSEGSSCTFQPAAAMATRGAESAGEEHPSWRHEARGDAGASPLPAQTRDQAGSSDASAEGPQAQGGAGEAVTVTEASRALCADSSEGAACEGAEAEGVWKTAVGKQGSKAAWKRPSHLPGDAWAGCKDAVDGEAVGRVRGAGAASSKGCKRGTTTAGYAPKPAAIGKQTGDVKRSERGRAAQSEAAARRTSVANESLASAGSPGSGGRRAHGGGGASPEATSGSSLGGASRCGSAEAEDGEPPSWVARLKSPADRALCGEAIPAGTHRGAASSPAHHSPQGEAAPQGVKGRSAGALEDGRVASEPSTAALPEGRHVGPVSAAQAVYGSAERGAGAKDAAMGMRSLALGVPGTGAGEGMEGWEGAEAWWGERQNAAAQLAVHPWHALGMQLALLSFSQLELVEEFHESQLKVLGELKEQLNNELERGQRLEALRRQTENTL